MKTSIKLRTSLKQFIKKLHKKIKKK